MIRHVIVAAEFVADVCNVVFKMHIAVAPGAPVLLRAVLYKHEQNQFSYLPEFTTKQAVVIELCKHQYNINFTYK